jgi:hypothetical protein
VDLCGELPRYTLSAAGAGRALGLGDGRRDDVLTSALGVPDLEVGALARLSATTEGDLVDAGGLVLTRDEPECRLCR